MKLIELKLKGFIGLNKGMGLDEIALPLGDLSGLVAFDGPNGRGKTTILENMQPFRTFASRRGTLKKHCYAKDSQKELTLEYNGDIIRTLIKMDAQTTRADEGFIWVNDKPLVDGKPTSYDKAIKEIFGSPNLFFWSIFCAQNSKKLTDLTTGKMKELFTEFLRLDRYAAYEDTIKQALGMVQGIGQGAIRNAQYFKDELDKFAGIRPDEIIKTEGDNLQVNQATLEKVQGEIRQVQTAIEDAKAAIAANAEKEKQKKAIGLDLIKAKQDLETLDKERADRNLVAGNQWDKIRVQITETLKVLEDAEAIKQAADYCMDLDNKIKKTNSELEVAYKALSKFQEQLAELNTERTEKTKIHSDLQHSELVKQATQKADDLSKRFKDVSEASIDADPDLIRMKAEHGHLVKQSLALDEKDAECISETCGLIVDAIAAKKAAAELLNNMAKFTAGWHDAHNDSLDEIRTARKEAEDHLAALQEKVKAEIAEADADLETIKKKIKMVESDCAGVQNTIDRRLEQRLTDQAEFDKNSAMAKKLNELEIATANLSRLEKQEQDAKMALGEIEKDYALRIQKQKTIIEELGARIGEIEINDKAEAEWQALVEILKKRQANEEELQKWIRNSENKVMDATRMQEQIKKLISDLAEAESTQGIITGELVQWEYLKAACGKKGLQALEIDGVSPVIEQYANDLLISTFGPMNTLRFETQDEDLKEVLNIIVMDPDGTETLLENKSGGEAVWILKSLRLALTLLSKEKGGRNFKTVLMDEEDGALSPANAVKFIGLYRSMMDIGGFDDCFYISHKQEAVGLANHRLIFGEKGIDID